MNTEDAHKEVVVRVKALVDQRIAPIVAALNEFPDIFTVSSCEGCPPDGPGVVAFTHQGSWKDAAKFVLWLADELCQRGEEDAAVSLVGGRYFNFTGRFDISLSAVELVAAELRAMAYKFRSDSVERAMAMYGKEK